MCATTSRASEVLSVSLLCGCTGVFCYVSQADLELLVVLLPQFPLDASIVGMDMFLLLLHGCLFEDRVSP